MALLRLFTDYLNCSKYNCSSENMQPTNTNVAFCPIISSNSISTVLKQIKHFGNKSKPRIVKSHT